MPDASKDSAAKDAASRYKKTLFLPETDFPMRAGLPKKEPQLLQRWREMDLYRQLRKQAQGKTAFVLHDGPPYANGHIHLGTALTKILKDFIVRSRQMTGFDANYVPGWDCHGLPIEWKVEEEFRSKGRAKRDVPTAEFRAACRQYADHWLGVQREEFRRLGGEGDWDNPYTTMAFSSEAAITAELLKFVRAGLVYRGSKPVMWSPVEQTALAEAEIEYHDHQSTTIWVKFPVAGVSYTTPPGRPDPFPRPASVVIWTTTPWTIPGNRAICFGPKISYGLYEVTAVEKIVDPKTGEELTPWTKIGEKLIVADKLWDSVKNAAKISDARRLGHVDPSTISYCHHPLRGLGNGYDFPVPLWAGDHVTDEDGTGFVHTAPGHGQEDYIAWMNKKRRPIRTTIEGIPGAARQAELESQRISEEIPHTVDEHGAFTDEAPGFEGEKVIVTEGKKTGKDGGANNAVIAALIEKGALLARGRLTHSYPHSWRSRAPVIFRATPQWFIRLDQEIDGGKTLREYALEAIDVTGFTPPPARNRIRAMVETRPDWLISRQRAWGVPLTFFVDKESGEILKDDAVDARILSAIRKTGADAWFDTSAEVFLGEGRDPAKYEKIDDILDVWFDSGSTHAFVLEARDDLTWPADVYCEGSDQHRGWFQSSLLESCGTRHRAPFKHIVTNGFVVDAEGRKMSKSLNNVIAPEQIIRDYGAEILRIWVAAADYTEDPRVSKEIINSAVDGYRKLRNTVRYLLGALEGFTDEERVSYAQMPELERYILNVVVELDSDIRKAYEAFDFKLVWRRILEFCALDLSAFYLDIRKDSLYCDHPATLRRRAARTAMAEIFERVTAWLAPICVFTMEEAYLTRHPEAKDSIHLKQFPETPKEWCEEKLAARWSGLRRVRRVVTGALEVERREKRIGASLEAAPVVYISDDALLASLEGRDLADLFITSDVKIEKGEGPAGAFRLDDVKGVGVVSSVSDHERCERCWRYLDDVGADAAHPHACARCADAVERLEKETA